MSGHIVTALIVATLSGLLGARLEYDNNGPRVAFAYGCGRNDATLYNPLGYEFRACIEARQLWRTGTMSTWGRAHD
jgi:hypothetical protein